MTINAENIIPILAMFEGDIDKAIDWIADPNFDDAPFADLDDGQRIDVAHGLGVLRGAGDVRDQTAAEVFCDAINEAPPKEATTRVTVRGSIPFTIEVDITRDRRVVSIVRQDLWYSDMTIDAGEDLAEAVLIAMDELDCPGWD